MSRDDKAGSGTEVNWWTIWWTGRNKETRTVDSRREQSSRLALHAKLDCRLDDWLTYTRVLILVPRLVGVIGFTCSISMTLASAGSDSMCY